MQIIAILASRNFNRSAQIYRSLGFELVDRQENYLVLRSPALELHFRGRPDLEPAHNPSGAYLRCENAAELSTLWAALAAHRFPDQGIPRLTRPELGPGGVFEFAFIDPDGNALTIGAAKS